MGVYQNLLLSILVGFSHPFTSYFDVHQGYKVSTHGHSGSFAIQTSTDRYLEAMRIPMACSRTKDKHLRCLGTVVDQTVFLLRSSDLQ